MPKYDEAEAFEPVGRNDYVVTFSCLEPPPDEI